MDTEIQAGDLVKYCLFDEKGKEHWLNGVIHGVKKYEDAGTNIITRVTYLVDTGRNTRTDRHIFNHRDREITKRHNKQLSLGHDPIKSIAGILKQGDLPADELGVEIIRQPEQLELPPEQIRKA